MASRSTNFLPFRLHQKTYHPLRRPTVDQVLGSAVDYPVAAAPTSRETDRRPMMRYYVERRSTDASSTH
jgi:hypothetical protein